MSPTETSDEQSTVAAKSWRYPAALVTAGLLLVVTGAAYFYWSVSRPLIYKSGRIAVHQGDSLTTVARQLQANGIISNVYCFIALAYVRGQTKSIKAGEYELPPELSIGGLLDQLISGRVVEYPLALIEGWTFPQILDLLRLSPKIRHTLSGLSPDQIMERLGHPDMHPEGRFFPDTYLYMAGTTDLSILSRAFERMQNQLEQKWATRSAGLPIKTPDEALTLASIVEKETGLGSERSTIAGVLVNRLKRGMRLQVDPTVIYGLGAGFEGNLTRQHLRSDTPYNTYTRYGLPPTPIAMPGGDALDAVMHPAQTSALYFVAKGDGSHVFSDTLDEHNQAVIKYQLGGKAKRFSSFSGDDTPNAVEPQGAIQ